MLVLLLLLLRGQSRADYLDTWRTVAVTAGPEYLVGAAYGAGTWVVVGDGIHSSPNGNVWTPRFASPYYNVVFANGKFVAVGQGLATSTDGISWTARNITGSGSMYSAAYGNNIYLAVGAGQTAPNGFTSDVSTDGTTWSVTNFGIARPLHGVAFGGGIFTAVGAGGTVLTTTNGLQWTARTSGTAVDLEDIIYANGLFVAVGYSGTIITSPNGINWTARTSGAGTVRIPRIAYGNGTFVAIVDTGNSGMVVTSVNGTTWTNHPLATGTMTAIAAGPGAFLGTIVRSIRIAESAVPAISVQQPAGSPLTAVTSTLSFRTSALGVADSKTITLENVGTANLTGLTAAISGTDALSFQAVTTGMATSLIPGATTTFDVKFQPSAKGARIASLRIQSNDPSKPNFDLSLSGIVALDLEFPSTGVINVPESGNATPYPSTIELSGVLGSVASIRIKLNGITHSYPDDLDLFLMAPDGRVCALMSDVGGSNPLAGVDLVLDDSAMAFLPDSAAISTGTYKPTNIGATESLPVGGTGSVGSSLASLAGASPNGAWRLFVGDDEAPDSGSLLSWSLLLQLSSPNSPIQDWRQLYFGSMSATGEAAFDADPNKNTIPNLVEYALGGDPKLTTTGQAILPVVSTDATSHCLKLSLNHFLDRNDLTLAIQAGDTTTGPWTNLARSINGSAFSVVTAGAVVNESGTGNKRTVTVCDLYPVTNATHLKRFMRLQVTNQ